MKPVGRNDRRRRAAFNRYLTAARIHKFAGVDNQTAPAQHDCRCGLVPLRP